MGAWLPAGVSGLPRVTGSRARRCKHVPMPARRELSRIVGPEHVLEAPPPGSPYNRDASRRRGLEGRAEAGVARQNGVMFAPDPGASEQAQIGGNVATNAGGPHALKYGVTGAWVAGLEAVLAPGELVALGGWARKDVAGDEPKKQLLGSRGT